MALPPGFDPETGQFDPYPNLNRQLAMLLFRQGSTAAPPAAPTAPTVAAHPAAPPTPPDINVLGLRARSAAGSALEEAASPIEGFAASEKGARLKSGLGQAVGFLPPIMAWKFGRGLLGYDDEASAGAQPPMAPAPAATAAAAAPPAATGAAVAPTAGQPQAAAAPTAARPGFANDLGFDASDVNMGVGLSDRNARVTTDVQPEARAGTSSPPSSVRAVRLPNGKIIFTNLGTSDPTAVKGESISEEEGVRDVRGQARDELFKFGPVKPPTPNADPIRTALMRESSGMGGNVSMMPGTDEFRQNLELTRAKGATEIAKAAFEQQAIEEKAAMSPAARATLENQRAMAQILANKQLDARVTGVHAKAAQEIRDASTPGSPGFIENRAQREEQIARIETGKKALIRSLQMDALISTGTNPSTEAWRDDDILPTLPPPQ